MADSPLHHLLRQLQRGELYTLTELATSLDVDQALLEQMFRDLERAGYIQTAEVCCQGSCHGCSQCESCQPLLGGRLWSITPKGLRALKAL